MSLAAGPSRQPAGGVKEPLGLTTLFSVHDLPIVRYMSDRMAVMSLRSLIDGPAPRVFFQPKYPYTAALVGRTPSLIPQPSATGAHGYSGKIPSPGNVAARAPICELVSEADAGLRGQTPELRMLKEEPDGCIRCTDTQGFC